VGSDEGIFIIRDKGVFVANERPSVLGDIQVNRFDCGVVCIETDVIRN